MIDYRKYEKDVAKIISSKKPMIFRLQLKNGNVAERVLTPIGNNNNIVLYSNKYSLFKTRLGYVIEDITKMDKTKMYNIDNENYPSKTPNTIIDAIVSLLSTGYIYIDN